MSGRKLVNADYNVTTDWKDETESKQNLKYGLMNIKWGEMDSSLAPVILAGSVVDVAGIIYVFDSDYTIPGTPTSGHNFVRLWESGGVLIGQLTVNMYPFNELLQGYYSPDNLRRYVLTCTSNGTTFSNKTILRNEYLYIKIDQNFTATDTIGKIQTFRNQAILSKTLTLGTSGKIVTLPPGGTTIVIYDGITFFELNDLVEGSATGDKDLYFASDASLKWDESLDQFAFDKAVTTALLVWTGSAVISTSGGFAYANF